MEWTKADFFQHRNDLFWKLYDVQDGYIKWNGYNDDYWWNSVSKSEKFRRRVGQQTGRIYELDPITNCVTVSAAEALAKARV